MGYTHYYDVPEELDQEKFNHLVEDVKKILQHVQTELDIPLADGLGEYGTEPSLTDDTIRFNGLEDDSHETMAIYKNKDSWGFCKTARKPYDIAVTATLIALKHHFGDEIKLGSDGGEDGFNAGRELCEKLFGYGNDLNLNK